MPEKPNLYIADLHHEAGISPLGNGAYRQVCRESKALLPMLMAERNMKCLGIYRLDPAHRAVFIFEANCVEDVRDVLWGARFMHWWDGRIYPVSKLEDMRKNKGYIPAAVTTSAKPV